MAKGKMTIMANFIADLREFSSEDDMVNLTVPEGASIWDEEGNLVSQLEFTIDENPPLLEENYEFIGQPYILQPDGVTFDQLARLTWSYDPLNISSRVAEEDLYIAYYDEITGEWVALSSIVDVVNDSVTAYIEHLTIFATIAYVPMLPADFTFSSLDIQPLQANVGDTVTISVLVSNIGEEEGSCTVELRIDDILEESKKLTLDGGIDEAVTFTTVKDEAATYSVDINGLIATFTVEETTINWFILSPVIAGLIALIVFLTVRYRGRI